MKKDVEGIVRKRSLIAKTRKAVFLWVMGASSVIGAAIVVAVMLVQTIVFNAEILSEKNETLATIESNIRAVPELEASVVQLNTNAELREVRLNDNARPLQAILDALPADENSLALGASLQQRIFTDIPGLSVDAMSIDTASEGVAATGDSATAGGGVLPLSFSATLSGDAESLKRGLQRAERSIRALDITSISATGTGNTVSLQLTGVAYYLPEQDLSLKFETRQQK